MVDLRTFQPDFEKFEKAITKKTKAVIINNPNNPTGAVYSEESIKKMAEILNKKQAEYNVKSSVISSK